MCDNSDTAPMRLYPEDLDVVRMTLCGRFKKPLG